MNRSLGNTGGFPTSWPALKRLDWISAIERMFCPSPKYISKKLVFSNGPDENAVQMKVFVGKYEAKMIAEGGRSQPWAFEFKSEQF